MHWSCQVSPGHGASHNQWPSYRPHRVLDHLAPSYGAGRWELECLKLVVEEKKWVLNKVSVSSALRKEGNYIKSDQGWCLFGAPLGAPVWAGAKHCHMSFPFPGSPWEAVLWHALVLVELHLFSPQLPWLLWSSGCCSCHGNCSNALNCCSLAWKSLVFWSSSVPTELSAVCLPQFLTTTVVLIYDEGRIGVNCQLWTERGSVDKISQYCVLNLEYYTGLETFSLKIVL